MEDPLLSGQATATSPCGVTGSCLGVHALRGLPERLELWAVCQADEAGAGRRGSGEWGGEGGARGLSREQAGLEVTMEELRLLLVD